MQIVQARKITGNVHSVAASRPSLAEELSAIVGGLTSMPAGQSRPDSLAAKMQIVNKVGLHPAATQTGQSLRLGKTSASADASPGTKAESNAKLSKPSRSSFSHAAIQHTHSSAVALDRTDLFSNLPPKAMPVKVALASAQRTCESQQWYWWLACPCQKLRQ